MDDYYVEDYGTENETDCTYHGTEYLEGKIYLIGIFATFIAILSIIFNTFYTIVFIRNPSLRRSGVFYFGVIGVIDIIMGVNYIAVMSLPVYMDYYHYFPLYLLFLSYCRFVLAETSWAMFSSMLLILLATTERLLKTFHGRRFVACRKYLEKNRAKVSAFCLIFAFAYKVCSYWEVDISQKETCDGWGKYMIIAGPFTNYPWYRFYWMFLTRNIIDRIAPFFILIIMNVLIIRTVKQEEQNQKESVATKDSTKAYKKNVRDATRALLALVSMYLLSQSLQVILTFWETIHKDSLLDYPFFYSYLNDIVSIFALLASCLRFPVYFCCNRLIHTASMETLSGLSCFAEKKIESEYSQIQGILTVDADGNSKIVPATSPNVMYDEKLEEWKL